MEKAGFNWKKAKAAEEAAREYSLEKQKTGDLSKNDVAIKAQEANGAQKSDNASKEVPALHRVTRLDIEKYKCVTEDIVTDEVIITDERIQHIKERHPNDYELYGAYIPEIINNPDYIIEDRKKASAIVLKYITEADERFRLAVRLATSTDDPNYKNSVITFLKIKEKEWKRLIKNKKILYKSE
jgi:hypothetical protein